MLKIDTQQGHKADAYSEEGAETEAHVVSVDGQRHLTVRATVAYWTVACEFGGRLCHTSAPVTWTAGTERVHADFTSGVRLDHVTWGTPAIEGDKERKSLINGNICVKKK